MTATSGSSRADPPGGLEDLRAADLERARLRPVAAEAGVDRAAVRAVDRAVVEGRAADRRDDPVRADVAALDVDVLEGVLLRLHRPALVVVHRRRDADRQVAHGHVAGAVQVEDELVAALGRGDDRLVRARPDDLEGVVVAGEEVVGGRVRDRGRARSMILSAMPSSPFVCIAVSRFATRDVAARVRAGGVEARHAEGVGRGRRGGDERRRERERRCRSIRNAFPGCIHCGLSRSGYDISSRVSAPVESSAIDATDREIVSALDGKRAHELPRARRARLVERERDRRAGPAPARVGRDRGLPRDRRPGRRRPPARGADRRPPGRPRREPTASSAWSSRSRRSPTPPT